MAAEELAVGAEVRLNVSWTLRKSNNLQGAP